MSSLAAWDSAALLLLLARVEREFEIHIVQQQLNEFTSFAAIAALLRLECARASRTR